MGFCVTVCSGVVLERNPISLGGKAVDTPEKRISLIVPFYNAEKYIVACVESIQNQSYENFEVIFVDDGSTDRSVELLVQYNDPRFRLLRQSNAGVSAARNHGLRHAHGEYIAFMDVDDELESIYLQKMLQVAEQNSTDVVLCNYYDIYSDGKIVENRLPWKEGVLDIQHEKEHLLFQMIEGTVRSSVWRTLVRKEFWKETGLFFDARVGIAEDLLFLILLYNRAKRIYIVSECLYLYRKNADSALNRYYPDGLEKNLQFHEIFVELLQSENIFDHYQEAYNINRICMYTAELSNQSRNPRLRMSRSKVKALSNELLQEPFNWRDYPISRLRRIALWMLEKRMYTLLLVLFRIKEWYRLRNYR